VDRVLLSQKDDTSVAVLPLIELRLKGTTRVDDLRGSYGIVLGVPDQLMLDAVIRQQLGDAVTVGTRLVLNGTVMRVCEMVDSRIATVGLLPEGDAVAEQAAA
jgi:potassium/hydrogen antiporter